MWTKNKFALLPLLFSVSLGVKFPRENAITVNGEFFRVGEFTSASCNFIKFKQENIHKIEWSINYNGVSLNAFVSNFDNPGSKDVPESGYFDVDEGSSGEKVIRLRLNDDREQEINICCKVESVRDNGYGMYKRRDAEKCVSVPVRSAVIQPAQVVLHVEQSLVRVGDQLDYHCEVDKVRSSNMQLDILINSQLIESKSVNEYDRQLRSQYRVAEDAFYQGRGEKFSLECLLKKGNFEVHRHVVTINRDRSSNVAYHPTITNERPDDARHADRQSKGLQMGSDDVSIVHCHKYVIVEEGSTDGTVVKGEISLDLQRSIGAYQSYNSRYESSSEVVNVLNTLGSYGYRVAGMGNNMLNRMTWTLERHCQHLNSYSKP